MKRHYGILLLLITPLMGFDPATPPSTLIDYIKASISNSLRVNALAEIIHNRKGGEIDPNIIIPIAVKHTTAGMLSGITGYFLKSETASPQETEETDRGRKPLVKREAGTLQESKIMKRAKFGGRMWLNKENPEELAFNIFQYLTDEEPQHTKPRIIIEPILKQLENKTERKLNNMKIEKHLAKLENHLHKDDNNFEEFKQKIKSLIVPNSK